MNRDWMIIGILIVLLASVFWWYKGASADEDDPLACIEKPDCPAFDRMIDRARLIYTRSHDGMV